MEQEADVMGIPVARVMTRAPRTSLESDLASAAVYQMEQAGIIAMPVLNGLEATRQITKQIPQTKVLILSSYSDDEYVQQLTEAGAAGYLVKQTAANDLLNLS